MAQKYFCLCRETCGGVLNVEMLITGGTLVAPQSNQGYTQLTKIINESSRAGVPTNLIYLLCPIYQLAPFINGAAPTIS